MKNNSYLKIILPVIVIFLSVFLVQQRTVLFKRAQTTSSQAYSPVYLCKYIPSSLYGAPESEWAKYECVNGAARLRSTAAIAVESQTQPLVENLQVPSVKSFASSVQTGEAAVSYPIEVPPAAGGFVPSLSLTYSSGVVADMRYGVTDDDWINGGWPQGSFIGLGWNLSGIPQIVKNGAGRYYLVIDGRSFELLGADGSDRMPDGQDAEYTTKPNNYLKIVRKYENPGVFDPHLKQPADCSGGGSLGENNVDFRSWDVWTKDGKHYIFKRLGFIIKDINCSDKKERNTDFDTPGHCPFSSPDLITNKRKRFFNKWVLTEAIDSSDNKIVYEYSPQVGSNSEGGNWQLAGNTLDDCRDKCLSNFPEPRFGTDRSWDSCTRVCFGGGNISDNLVETGRKAKSQCDNERCPNCSFDCKAFNLTCSRRSDCQAAGDTQWKDICLKGCFGTGSDPVGETANHCNGGIYFPRAIYPTVIKYGKGIKETANESSQTNKIEFIYDKREDNNFGTMGEGTQISSGDRKLARINVYLGGSKVRSYQLAYSYSGSGQNIPKAPSDSYSTFSPAPKVGMLLLDSIKLLGTDDNTFPANQSFTYYPYNDAVKSFLLKTAGNGYGAMVEYNYEDQRNAVEIFNESVSGDGSQYFGSKVGCIHFNQSTGLCEENKSNQKKSRARLKSKVTSSSFDPAKKQIVAYDYIPDKSWNDYSSYCGLNDGISDCKYNAHALISLRGDYEFLGYSRVKETLFYQDSVHTTPTAQSAVYYNFNPGGNEKQCRGSSGLYDCFQTRIKESQPEDTLLAAKAYFRKGTAAGKTTVKYEGGSGVSNEIPIAAENNTYETILDEGVYKNLFFPQESKACSDLDITNQALRRGTYSKTTDSADDFSLADVFDRFGNQKKQRQYKISSCGVDFGSSKYYPTVNAAGQTIYRSTIIAFKDPDLSKYIVSLPSSIEVKTNDLGTLSLYSYNSNGKLAETVSIDAAQISPGNDKRAIVVNVSYDSFGNSSSQTVYEGYGSVTLRKTADKWSYSLAGTPSGARVTATAYDEKYAVFPKIVTNPAGFKIETTYDLFGRPIAVKDIDNDLTSRTEYDTFGRIVKNISPADSSDSPTVKYQYTDQNVTNRSNIPAMTVKVEKKDVGGYLSSYTFYDDLGQTLQTQSQSDETGKVFADRIEYDALGRAVKSFAGQEVNGTLGNYFSSTPNDFDSIVNYDSQGRSVRLIGSDGSCTLTEYNGRQTFSYDSNGNLSSSWIDELGRSKGSLVYVKGTSGAAVSKTGNTKGTAGIKGPLDLFRSFVNPSLDKVLIGTGGLSPADFKGTYCNSSRIFNSPSSYPRANASYSIFSAAKNIYDNMDRVIAVRTLNTIHDVNNLADETGDDTTPNLLAQSTTAYDGFGRVSQAFDPDLGNSYVRSYDALGQALTTEDNNGVRRSTAYDLLGRITAVYEGNTLKAKLTYDDSAYGKAKGKLVKEETPNVLSREYFYNGTISGVNTGLLSATTTKLLDSSGIAASEKLTYDESGKNKTKKTSLIVPAAGRVPGGILEDETLTTNYDSIGRLSNIQTSYAKGETPQGNVYLNNVTYNQFNLIQSKTYGNGNIESFTYNEADKSLRLKSHTVTNNLMFLAYNSYDNAGNILTLAQTLSGSTKNYNYLYDDLYRLTNVTSPYNASYTYDKLGRMTNKNENVNIGFNYSTFIPGTEMNQIKTYFPLNAPKTANGVGLSYQNGNLLKMLNGNTLTYDNENRLIEARFSDNPTLTPTPTPGSRTWNITSQPVCPLGKTPKPMRMFRVFWGAGDFTCANTELRRGNQSMTITSRHLNDGVYVGLEVPERSGAVGNCSEGTSFEVISIAPNSSAVTLHAKYMNPYNWMTRWMAGDLPSGNYTLQFQIPAEYCE